MKAVAVVPRQKGSLHFVDMPLPVPTGDELLVRILQVTLDGTDAEINQGVYGDAPAGEKDLVIGHEALGRVETSANPAYIAGELVVPLVRRPGACVNCRNGRSDMCLDGDFLECGIKGAHGYLREFAAISPEFLVKVPPEQQATAMLAEPLSISVKGFEQALEFHRARHNSVHTVAVLGAGSLGTLATALVRSHSFNTWVMDTVLESHIKAQLVKALGAKYINGRDVPLSSLPNEAGNLDVILETTGNSQLVFEACRVLGRNGVLCLMGIAAGEQTLTIGASSVATQMVMENKLVFGTVSSNCGHFERALRVLAEIQDRWPDWLPRLITNRLRLEDAEKAFDSGPNNVKTVLEIA